MQQKLNPVNEMQELPAVSPRTCEGPLEAFAGMASRWESVVIPTNDGVRLAGSFGRPSQPRHAGLRAVLFVHGFTAERTENGLFSDVAERLVDSGYLVAMYDWRGLGSSEGDFSTTTLGKHTSDFRNVAAWFRRSCGLAPADLCLVGFSLGAALVVRAVRRGMRPGACSLWSPAVRPRRSMWPRYDSPKTRAELRLRGYIVKPETAVRLGAPILNSLRATDLGPTAFALGVPLLVCHGTDDARIPVEHSREVFRSSGQEQALYAEFNGASHSFRPAADQRGSLFDLFLHWLADDGFRSRRGQLEMPQGWQAPLAASL